MHVLMVLVAASGVQSECIYIELSYFKKNIAVTFWSFLNESAFMSVFTFTEKYCNFNCQGSNFIEYQRKNSPFSSPYFSY